MVDGQSITIATAATVALGAIVGIYRHVFAYVFSHAVPHRLTFVK
jgi:hypothetical protein